MYKGPEKSSPIEVVEPHINVVKEIEPIFIEFRSSNNLALQYGKVDSAEAESLLNKGYNTLLPDVSAPDYISMYRKIRSMFEQSLLLRAREEFQKLSAAGTTASVSLTIIAALFRSEVERASNNSLYQDALLIMATTVENYYTSSLEITNLAD
jgi:hypothetical protein